jgi:hypothetical protein
MRTTITLDDDVVTAVKDEMMSGEGKTFKQAVNDLIRFGRLKRRTEKVSQKAKPFKVRAKNMGTYPHLNYDNIGELLDQVEGPFRR